jgi:hypothetical protein
VRKPKKLSSPRKYVVQNLNFLEIYNNLTYHPLNSHLLIFRTLRVNLPSKKRAELNALIGNIPSETQPKK